MSITVTQPIWLDNPQKHDYPAAANYLSLILEAPNVDRAIKELKKAKTVHYFAKDILRASRLSLLPLDDVHVAGDLTAIIRGEKLSPVLLVRGHLQANTPLTIADGYHRVCTGYHVADNTPIPCRIVDLPNVKA